MDSSFNFLSRIAIALNDIANSLKNTSSTIDIIIPIVTTIFSVFVGGFLGYYLSVRAEKKRLIIENHRKFLEDFNSFYIKVHELYQKIHSYNELITHLGFPQLQYDYTLTHKQNIPNIDSAEKEYQKYVKATVKGKFPNKDSYWEIIHNTCVELLSFNLIINLVQSMNQNAQITSMFVSKNIKIAFDRLIAKTQVLTQNNYQDFNIYQYRLELIGILQLIKNELDPHKNPIYYESQMTEIQKDFDIKINTFSNCFKVYRIKGDKIYCRNAKRKKFCFEKQEIELF